MPSFKNSLGGRTTVDTGSNCNRTTVRDKSGKVKSVTETHGSVTHTKTYDSNGKVSYVWKRDGKIILKQ